jgi:hypothetical protein
MNANEQLQQVNGAIRSAKEGIDGIKKMLRPYWQAKEDIEDRIKVTHHHRITPVYRDGEQTGERIDVTGFDFSGVGLRAPLFPKLDALSEEFGPLRTEQKQIESQLKALEKTRGLILKTIEKEQRRKLKKAAENATEKHRCAQCNGEPDGTEKLIRGVWLHAECAKFYNFED